MTEKKVHVYCLAHVVVRFEVEAESLEAAAVLIDQADADALYALPKEVVTDSWQEARENVLRPDEVAWVEGEGTDYVRVTWDGSRPVLGEAG